MQALTAPRGGYGGVNFQVAKYARDISPFALAISTRMLMLQMRTERAVAQHIEEHTMRSIAAFVLPIIAALSTSGLMFSATLA